MREHTLVTRRTARYYALGNAHAADVWFVLHGYAQLARYFLRSFEPIAGETRLVVAPEALNRYYVERGRDEPASAARVGATWMTREHREHEIADYIAYLDLLAEHVTRDVASPNITVLGFSQGAATASRWAAHGRTRIDHLILWGASLAHELEPGADLFGSAKLTIVAGRQDAYLPAERIAAEHGRLRAAGLHAALLEYDGAHRIEPDALHQLAG